jgi:putative protease
MDNIDDLMTNLEERERRGEAGNQGGQKDIVDVFENKDEHEGYDESGRDRRRVLVGRVEHFYDKISVAAIRLTRGVRIGDTIEIESGNETVRLRVLSMQIDRKDVEAASEGDDVGIKVERRVSEGSRVYAIG